MLKKKGTALLAAIVSAVGMAGAIGALAPAAQASSSSYYQCSNGVSTFDIAGHGAHKLAEAYEDMGYTCTKFR